MDILCISVGMTMTGGYVLLPAVHHMSSSVNQPPPSWRAFTHVELICRSRACVVCCCVAIKRSRCSHGVFLLTRSSSMIGKTQPKRKGLRTSIDMVVHSTSPLLFPKPTSYKSVSPIPSQPHLLPDFLNRLDDNPWKTTPQYSSASTSTSTSTTCAVLSPRLLVFLRLHHHIGSPRIRPPLDDDGCDNIEKESNGPEGERAKGAEEEDPDESDGGTQPLRKSMREASMPISTSGLHEPSARNRWPVDVNQDMTLIYRLV